MRAVASRARGAAHRRCGCRTTNGAGSRSERRFPSVGHAPCVHGRCRSPRGRGRKRTTRHRASSANALRSGRGRRARTSCAGLRHLVARRPSRRAPSSQTRWPVKHRPSGKARRQPGARSLRRADPASAWEQPVPARVGPPHCRSSTRTRQRRAQADGCEEGSARGREAGRRKRRRLRSPGGLFVSVG